MIANKLEAEISEGRKHTNVVVRFCGTYIGRFGIRRGSSAGHDYIPRQIHITMKEADPELRDTENVPLREDVESFFEREVTPHAPLQP